MTSIESGYRLKAMAAAAIPAVIRKSDSAECEMTVINLNGGVMSAGVAAAAKCTASLCNSANNGSMKRNIGFGVMAMK